jgi:hypothetical protein
MMETVGPSSAGPSPRRESSRQRASRIPLDYWKHRGPIDRWKLILSGMAAVLIVLVWLGARFALPGGDNAFASPGSIVRRHLEETKNQCSSCHVDFHPISTGNALSGVIGVSEGCKQCHKEFNAADHHANQSAGMTPSCGSCHHDHRGLNASLVNLPDSDCTSCHRDLAKSMSESKLKCPNKVTDFVTDHPDFKVEPKPERIKFNHALHLTPGQKSRWTLAQVKAIDAAAYKRYSEHQEKKDPNDLVTLDCASCHRIGPKGAYMEPIKFDTDCKGCHALTYEEGLKAVEHGHQPAVFKSIVEKEIKDHPLKTADVPPAVTPLPGRSVDAATPKSPTAEQRIEWAQRILFAGKQTCAECHYFEAPVASWPVVKPAQLSPVWQPHAIFNHEKHKAMNCVDCHKQAQTSTSSAVVALPDKASCVECHKPGGRQLEGKAAPSNCTTCHLYHHGDEPMQRFKDRGLLPK